MKKEFGFRYGLEVSLIGLIVCLIILYATQEALRLNPFEKTTWLDDPSVVVLTDKGSTYVITDGYTNIVQLDENYLYRRTLHGGKDVGGFNYAQDMTLDEEGNLYIHDRLLDDKGKDVETERICWYTPNGIFQSYLLEQPHGDLDEENQNNRLLGLTWREDALWYIRVDYNRIVLCRLDPEEGPPVDQKVYYYPNAYTYIMNATIRDDGTIFFDDKMGNIWLASQDGNHTCIYNGAQYKTENYFSIPRELTTDVDGNILFNDRGLREIRRIRLDTAPFAVETLIECAEVMEEPAESFSSSPLLSSVSVSSDGTIGTIGTLYSYDFETDESIYDYLIYCRDADGNVLFNGAEVEKDYAVNALSCIGFLAILLTIAALAYLILSFLFSGALTNMTSMSKIQLAVITAALISSFAVIAVVVQETNARYLDTRTDKIKNLAILISDEIDPYDIRRLDSPDDYRSDAYLRIDETVHKVMGEGELNSDGTYCEIYATKNDILFDVYSEGHYNVMDPVDGSFHGTQEEYIFDSGEIVVNAALSSADGFYTFTYSPIFYSNGLVAGLVEVGADLNALEAENQEMIGRILLTVLLMVITCLLMFSEGIIFFATLIQNRHERKAQLTPDVNIIRPIHFIALFAFNMSTAFMPVYGMQLWTYDMNMSAEFASALPLSIEVVAVAIFSLVGGYIIDRVGTKQLTIIGTIIYAAGLFLYAIAPNLWFLFGSSVLFGIGEGLFLVATSTFVTNYADDEQRNKGFSAQNAAYLSGMNCGTVIGSLIAEKFGYRSVFFASAALAAGSLLLIIICMHRQKEVLPEFSEEDGGEGLSTIGFLLKPRVFSFLIFMLLPYTICASFLSYFFPIFGEENGLSASFISMAFLLSGVIAIYLGPALTDLVPWRIGNAGSLILATVLYVVAFALFAVQPTIPMCFIIIAILAVADSFGLSMQSVYFSDLPEVRQLGAGKAMGLNSTVESIAQTIGPLLFAGVLLLGVTKGVMLLAAGVGVLLVLFCFFYLQQRRKDHKRRRATSHHQAPALTA